VDTTSLIGYAVHDGPRYASAPISIAVGHKSTLVAAGLAATLARMPECDVHLSQLSGLGCDSHCSHDDAQLIFGDSALLKQLRNQFREPGKPCLLASAQFVWVTAGDESGARAAKEAGQIDEHLPVDCPEEELFAIVRRLIRFDATPGSWARRPPASAARCTALGGLAPGALRRVREYIEAHLTENFRTEVLAGIALLSCGHFNRAFKQSVGVSPHRYIIQKRVAAATELLRQTTRALADIALDVGFADQSHFSRTFAAITGETPSACRRRHR
jgi:AraC-like DNA-binding protein